MTDLHFVNHGSIVLLHATSAEGQMWLDENIGGEEVQTFCNDIVIEPRYVSDIMQGALDDGLVCGGV